MEGKQILRFAQNDVEGSARLTGTVFLSEAKDLTGLISRLRGPNKSYRTPLQGSNVVGLNIPRAPLRFALGWY